MKYYSLLLIVCLLAVGCKKEVKTEPTPSSLELLTQKAWTLSGYGFDDNQNGQLDVAENQIQNCQADNIYLFIPGGTGVYFDNTITCGTELSADFNWKLLSDNQILEIEFERLLILRLNSAEMNLQANIGGSTVPYIITYKH